MITHVTQRDACKLGRWLAEQPWVLDPNDSGCATVQTPEGDLVFQVSVDATEDPTTKRLNPNALGKIMFRIGDDLCEGNLGFAREDPMKAITNRMAREREEARERESAEFVAEIIGEEKGPLVAGVDFATGAVVVAEPWICDGCTYLAMTGEIDEGLQEIEFAHECRASANPQEPIKCVLPGEPCDGFLPKEATDE